MKLGYKQTDVGVIPEDWELGDLHRSMTYAHGKAHEPFVAEWGKYTIVNSKFIATEGAVKKVVTSNFCPAQQGDVLMVLSDLPNGRALAKTYTAGSEASMLAVNQRVVRLRPNPMQCDGSYAGYAINRHPYFLKFDDGVTQTHLLNKHLDEFKFPLPPIKEQRAIAEVLSDVDAEIESLSQRHEKLVAQKQGLSEELLSGRTRLVEPKSKGFKQTDVGMIPEDWEVHELGELCVKSIRYGIVQPGKYDDQGRYMLRGQDYSLAKGWARPSDIFRVSKEVEEKYANARVSQGDLVMTIVGYCGHVELIPDWLDGANLTQTTARISTDRKLVDSEFMKNELRGQRVQKQVDENTKGAAQPGLNCSDVSGFQVVLPPMKEQRAIAEVLSDVDAEIRAVAKLKAKVQAKKEGLMQTLLTGKIRLT